MTTTHTTQITQTHQITQAHQISAESAHVCADSAPHPRRVGALVRRLGGPLGLRKQEAR